MTAPGLTPQSVSSLAGALLYPKDDGDLKRYLVEFIDQPQIAERPIDKEARMTYIGTEVSNTNFLVRQQFGSKAAPGVSHYATNRLARRYTCHEPDRLPVEAFQLPAKAVVDILLEAYFTHVNPMFPVVDQDLFTEQYRARDPSNPPSLLLLHAMLVAGAHVWYQQPERDAQKSLFFRRAKTLFDARFERNRDTVVQAALLLTWHADGVEDILANAWFWIGVAARTAMGLGMHRDADRSTLVPHNKRMWRRVWWLPFQCDVMVSLQYGRPPAIRLDETDVKDLQPLDFQDCGPRVQAEYCIQQTKLCIIISRGMQGQFHLSSSPSTGTRSEHLHRTDQELAKWLLQQSLSETQSSSSQVQLSTATSQILYNTALILLHRGQPYEQDIHGTSDVRRDDASICCTAAFAVQQIFHQLCEYNQIKCLWVFGVNCLFTAIIQLSVQIKTSNPVVAISAFRRYESALTSMRHVTDYWPNAKSILHFFENFVRPRLPGIGQEQSEDAEEPDPEVAPTRGKETEIMRGEGPEVAQGPLYQQSSADNTVDASQNMDGRGVGDFGNATFENVEDILEAWQDWQRSSGNTDDFLFTF